MLSPGSKSKIAQQIEEEQNQWFLSLIAEELISINGIGAYVITGGAFGYFFQTTIIQRAENQIQVRRWHDINPSYVKVAQISGRTDWNKVIACVRKNGCIPDATMNPNIKRGIGRYVTNYVVTKNDQAWARINSADCGLCVHKLYNAMLRIEERAFSDLQQNSGVRSQE